MCTRPGANLGVPRYDSRRHRDQVGPYLVLVRYPGSSRMASAKRILPPKPGETTPFGPVIRVTADAAPYGPYAQLAAWLGRRP